MNTDDSICVLIPHKGMYTLYAEGYYLGKRHENGRTYIYLSRLHPVILYYTYPLYRVLYVCTYDGSTAGCRLDGVSCSLHIIERLTGRSFDRFKRALYRLSRSTEGRIYTWQASFFWRLAALCRQGKTGGGSIPLLAGQYDVQEIRNGR